MMTIGEMFLGGFASGFLARGFHIGYGLYFTTNRVIGIDLGSEAVGHSEARWPDSSTVN
jgi:hypothetical protein